MFVCVRVHTVVGVCDPVRPRTHAQESTAIVAHAPRTYLGVGAGVGVELGAGVAVEVGAEVGGRVGKGVG